MADINSVVPVPLAAAQSHRLDVASGTDEGHRLIRLVELLFFAYRDFTAEPDAILSEFGFGRAHHRVLHFVQRHPGLRVADLLDILKITKQSLARVLKQLIGEGYIVQEAGRADRRERLLFVTPAGAALADKLASLQVDRVARALQTASQTAGAADHGGTRREPLPQVGSVEASQLEHLVARFLFAMIAADDRDGVEALLSAPARK